MYNAFRQLCVRLLRIPSEPEPPPGDNAQTQIFRAAPNYYKYLLALWALKTAATFLIVLIAFIGPLAAIFANSSRGNGKWAILMLVFAGVVFLLALAGRLFALALVRLDFENRWYVVTDRSVRVREGIIQVREATVTFANIQNISIDQGPLQRALGIADLRLDTAGGGGGATQGKHGAPNLHVVRFRGVNNAIEIKDLVQLRLRQFKDSGLGDHEEMVAQPAASISSSIEAALREVCAEATALRTEASRRT